MTRAGRLIVSLLTMSVLASSGRIVSDAEALTASWYSVASLKKEGTWRYSHGQMANGKWFQDDKYTAASWGYPLGTILKVSNTKTATSVTVCVSDRTARRFKGKRIDLSKAAFSKIARLEQGLVEVQVRRIR